MEQRKKKKRAESLSHIEGVKTNKQTTQTTLQTTQKSGISNLFTTCWVKLSNIWNNVIRNLDAFVKCSYFIFMVECPNISIRILRNFEKWYHWLNSVWVCFFLLEEMISSVEEALHLSVMYITLLVVVVMLTCSPSNQHIQSFLSWANDALITVKLV